MVTLPTSHLVTAGNCNIIKQKFIVVSHEGVLLNFGFAYVLLLLDSRWEYDHFVAVTLICSQEAISVFLNLALCILKHMLYCPQDIINLKYTQLLISAHLVFQYTETRILHTILSKILLLKRARCSFLQLLLQFNCTRILCTPK